MAALVALVALGLACMPAPRVTAPDPETTASAGIQPAPLDLSSLAWKAGLEQRSWSVGGQGLRSASVWIPEAPVPGALILLLHGALPSTPRRSEQAQIWTRRLIQCLAVPAFVPLNPLIIAPQSTDGQWWKVSDTEFVLGLVAAARQRWPEITARSVIMGYSNGGIATWYFARLYPQYFSAAIPMAFNDSIVGATPLPVYAIQGDKDELFPIAPVRAAVEAQRAHGVDVTLLERYRAGHMNACAYEPELTRAASWLEEHAFAGAHGTAR